MSKFAWRVPGVKCGLKPTSVPLLVLVRLFHNVPTVSGSNPFPAKIELREKPTSRFFVGCKLIFCPKVNGSGGNLLPYSLPKKLSYRIVPNTFEKNGMYKGSTRFTRKP